MKGSPRWPAGRKEGAPCFGFPLEVADVSMAVVVEVGLEVVSEVMEMKREVSAGEGEVSGDGGGAEGRCSETVGGGGQQINVPRRPTGVVKHCTASGICML